MIKLFNEYGDGVKMKPKKRKKELVGYVHKGYFNKGFILKPFKPKSISEGFEEIAIFYEPEKISQCENYNIKAKIIIEEL